MERVYKPALPAEEALRILEINALEHYDPAFYFPFVASLRKSLRLYEDRKKNLDGTIYIVEKGENVAKTIQSSQQRKSKLDNEPTRLVTQDKHVHDESCEHSHPLKDKKIGA
jgi:hypothetical protein